MYTRHTNFTATEDASVKCWMRQTQTQTCTGHRITWCSDVSFFFLSSSSAAFSVSSLQIQYVCLCQSGMNFMEKKTYFAVYQLTTYTQCCKPREWHAKSTFLWPVWWTCVLCFAGMNSRLSTYGCCYCEGFFGIHLQQAHQSFSYFVRSFSSSYFFSY